MQRRVNFSGLSATVHSCMFMQLHREKIASRSLPCFSSISSVAWRQRPQDSKQHLALAAPAVAEAALPLSLYDVINVAGTDDPTPTMTLLLFKLLLKLSDGDNDIDERIALIAAQPAAMMSISASRGSTGRHSIQTRSASPALFCRITVRESFHPSNARSTAFALERYDVTILQHQLRTSRVHDLPHGPRAR